MFDNDISQAAFESHLPAGRLRLELHQPLMITSRLMAGVQVGDATISIEYGGATPDGRRAYHYYIDFADGTEYEGGDLASGVGGGTLQAGLESLLSFLSACGESVSYSDRNGEVGENADLFPPNVGEWCAQNSDELASLECELQETPGLIVEN